MIEATSPKITKNELIKTLTNMLKRIEKVEASLNYKDGKMGGAAKENK